MVKIVKWFWLIIMPVITLWGGYTVDYSPSEFSFYKENGFDRIQAKGFEFYGEPGSPELPAVNLRYIIPPNTKVDSLIIIESDITQITGSYLIYPVQPPHMLGETLPWVPPDTVIYNSDELFPDTLIKVVNEGIMDGARIVTIEVCPIQYRPKSKRLFLVNNISFEFALGSNSPPELHAQIRGKYEQAVYDAVLSNAVVNRHEIQAYYQKPIIVEENQTYGAVPVPVAPGVIITDSSFFSAFQPYADWMTDQGIQTILISPGYIYQKFVGVDDAEKVRNYIEWCYKRGGGTWFILGGDDYFFPVRYGIPKDQPGLPIGENDSIPCDHYFSDLTGNWNCDGDDYWGELTDDSADCYAEVFVSRVTALDTFEVKNWVTKALHYEKIPGVKFNEALWINDGFYNGPAHDEFPSYFTHKDANHYWADDALYEIDSGYAFVNLNCHGNIGDFTPWNNAPGGRATIYNWWPDPPGNHRAGLDWLTNINKYFFVYGISCHCGAFDSLAHAIYYEEGSDTCIADAFVDTYLYNHQGNQGPFGACAGVLQTRSPHALWNNLQTRFYEALFSHRGDPDNDTVYSCLGVALALSKAKLSGYWNTGWAYRHGFYCQNLFGSPATEAWTKTPGYMSVTHPNQIPVGEETEFTVIVKTFSLPPVPLQYAKICLNKPDDIYEVGNTDANGEVTFVIKPKTTGMIKVTATRFHNIENDYDQYRPSQTTCNVLVYPGGGQQASDSGNTVPSTLCFTQTPTIFSNNTIINYGVPHKGDITLSLYDITGSRMDLIKKRNLLPGYYQERINTKKLTNGIYFIVLKQGDRKVNKKFILVR